MISLNPNTKVMAVKIVPSHHCDSFLNGSLYMNRPSFFRSADLKDPVRSDPDDGIHAVFQLKSVAIKNAINQWIPASGLQGPAIVKTPESSNFNMFCMYLFTDKEIDTFDSRNLNFGDKFVLITDFVEFIRRVKVAAEGVGQICYHGAIEYLDRQTHNGYVGPFRKFSQFDYQNEFRIALMNSDDKPITLSIGSIRDICIVGDSPELPLLIKEIRKNGGVHTRDSNVSTAESNL